jgi:hypothetical protein
VSSPGDAGSAALRETPSRRSPTWPRIAVVAAVLVGAFAVSRSCGTSDIKTTQEEAVATATAEANFDPADTQVRLLRQGIDRHPFWIVSLSTLSPDGDTYTDLAVARVDATSGEIVEFKQQEDTPAEDSPSRKP